MLPHLIITWIIASREHIELCMFATCIRILSSDSVLYINLEKSSVNTLDFEICEAEAGLAELVAVVEHVLSPLVLEHEGVGHGLGIPTRRR